MLQIKMITQDVVLKNLSQYQITKKQKIMIVSQKLSQHKEADNKNLKKSVNFIIIKKLQTNNICKKSVTNLNL